MEQKRYLDEILKDLKIKAKNQKARALLQASENSRIEVTDVSNNSKTVKPGGIFVAIKGYEADGHDYLEAARKQGAILAITERIVDEADLPQLAVEQSRKALALAVAAFYGHPSEGLNITGITGSNGKTSCSLMLRQIYLAAGRDPGMIGTVFYSSRSSQLEAKLTTPDATLLQKLFAEMKEDGMKDVIMEVSSIGREQFRDAGTRYQVVSLINLSREHLDHHKTMENYFAVKKDLIMSADEKAFAVLNADDPYSASLVDQCRAQVITFGHKKEADVRAVNVDLSTGCAHFEVEISKRIRPGLRSDERRLPLSLNVPGYHSMMNALAAFAMALAQNISFENIVLGLSEYHGVERRFQNVFSGDFRVFDDHFANAGNIRLTLETMRNMDYPNLHMVYAIRGSRGVTVCRDSLNELFSHKELLKKCKIYATLSEDVVGHYNEVKPEEQACFEQMMQEEGIPYTLDRTLEAAVKRALDAVKKDDIILLAGCQGMDAGARLLLEELARRHPAWNRERLMSPVKDRICGREGELA